MKIVLLGILLAVLAIGSAVWYVNKDFANKFKESVAHVITIVCITAFILWTIFAPFLV